MSVKDCAASGEIKSSRRLDWGMLWGYHFNKFKNMNEEQTGSVPPDYFTCPKNSAFKSVIFLKDYPAPQRKRPLKHPT